MCPHKLSSIPPLGRYRPGVEGLEARDLPSGATPHLGPAALVRQPVADSIRSPSHAMEASRRLLSGSRPVDALAEGSHTGRLLLPNPNLIPGFINTLYGPNSATPGQQPVAASIQSPAHAMEASRRLLSGSRPVHALTGDGHAGRQRLPNPNLIP
ncbi:MAG: hypothetical protein JO284_07525, partial [Planctomycetaceae bacterium]|nr:hypothetical protein [Planctomycetaceae bacterium]